MKRITIVTEDSRRYPMGLTVMGERIHMSAVWPGERCALVLFEHGKEEPWQTVPMDPRKRRGDVWSLTAEITGVRLSDLEYCLELDGVRRPDPCGRHFMGRDRWGDPANLQGGLRCPLAEEPFAWEDDMAPGIPYEDCVFYRLHVRGFTRHSSSKVKDRGTFQAVAEKIPYLKDLGVTTVELVLPSEFQEVMSRPARNTAPPEAAMAAGDPAGKEVGREATGKLNYWGYGESSGYAPKASYSAGRKKHPAGELKELVKQLHRAGLELVTELYFTGEEPPAQVLDTVRFWVEEFHLDGVHLVGAFPAQLLAEDPYLSSAKLLAAGWEGTSGGRTRHLAECNDGYLEDMRRVLKGDEDQMNRLVFRSRRNPQGAAVLNYMASTNGFTMMDMVSYDRKHNEANGENNLDGTDANYSWNCGTEGPTKKKKVLELRRKQLRNAFLMLFLSQGTPLLLAGDEFGNSQSGNNNAYCQDNEISWLNWNLLRPNRDLYAFVRQCIAFRKAHPIFHMEKELMAADYLACGHPDLSYHGSNAWRPEFESYSRQMGMLYCGCYGKKPDGSDDDFFFVIYNMHWEPHTFALPNLPKGGRWYLLADTEQKGQEGYFRLPEEQELEDQKTYLAAERSMAVLAGRIEPEPESKKARRGSRPKEEKEQT